MHSFQSVLRYALFVVAMVMSWAGHCGAAEMLWQKNLKMGLPDTPFISADITPDPGRELAFATTTGNLVVCNIEGEILWTAGGYSVFCVPPTAGDLFPGGGMELLAVNRGGRLTCLSSKGEELWQYQFPSGMDWCLTTIVSADLNRDGQTEILCGDMNGHFACLNRFGLEEWVFQVPGGFHCPPAVCDLNGDGLLDIVITSGEGHLLALNDAGEPLWMQEVGFDNYSGPVIADVDVDGTPEILLGGKDAQLHCFTNTGELRWQSPLEKETDTSISVGDLLGGKELEIVCMDLAGICYCFDAEGNELWRQGFIERSRRPPSLADFNNDGRIEVLASGYYSGYVLLTGAGEIIERTPGQSTNGGATLVDYHGKLAAVVPGMAGLISCMTWQEEPLPVLPKVLWGMYRVEPGNSGVYGLKAVPPQPRRILDTANEPVLSVYDAHAAITGGLRDTIGKLTKAEEKLSECDVQLADLSLNIILLNGQLQEAEDLQNRTVEHSEESTLRIARQTVLALESAHSLNERSEAIIPIAENLGTSKLAVWPTNPWWHIRSADRERDEYLSSNDIALSLYRNEVESAAINIMNLESRACTVRVVAPETVESATGPQLEILEVISVPTEQGDYSDDALSELNQARTIHLAPGETRQVFLSVHAGPAEARNYACDIQFAPIAVSSIPISIPLRVHVLDIDLEDGEAPKLCTWGYVYSSVLKDHSQEAWRNRIQHGNNVIVITTHYLPRVRYDEHGEIMSEIDFSRLGEFVRQRPEAFFLFFNYQGTLRGPQRHGADSSAYKKAFRTWLQRMVAFLAKQNVGYDRFALYPVDEPGLRPGLVDLHIQHARLARDADPKVLLYTDPVAGADMNDIQRMREYVDIWCPNRNSFLLQDEEPRLDVMKANALAMWTYECMHHAKHRPPLEYYRGLAWLSELRGLSGFGFWSYCTSSDSPWEFPHTRGHDYLLVYPGDGVVNSRRWEACRDGSEDMRALMILKQSIQEAAAQGLVPDEIAEAKRIIQEATEELGRFNLVSEGKDAIEIVGKDWVTVERVDAEWEAYRRHRRRIAEATLSLRAAR